MQIVYSKILILALVVKIAHTTTAKYGFDLPPPPLQKNLVNKVRVRKAVKLTWWFASRPGHGPKTMSISRANWLASTSRVKQLPFLAELNNNGVSSVI
jgi:hypothetical protein